MTLDGVRMHQTAVAKIEAGTRPVLIGEAVMLASIVGATVGMLIGESDRPGRDYERVTLRNQRMRLRHELAEAAAAAERIRSELAEVDSELQEGK